MAISPPRDDRTILEHIYAIISGAVPGPVPYVPGLDYTYKDTNFVAGDSPATLDVNNDLGRNGHLGFIICGGPGNIDVKVSNDGVSYGGIHTMKPGEVYPLNSRDVDRIQLIYTGIKSAYRVDVW